MAIGYPDEVKEYAREMFFTPNEEGTHKYSFTDISNSIKRAFPDMPKHPDRTTIQRWSTTKSVTGKTWATNWAEGVMKGVIEAKKDFEETKGEEEKIRERVELFERRLSLIGMDLFTKGYKPYAGKNFEPENNAEGMKMMNMALTIFRSQAEQLKEVEDKIVNIYIERDDSIVVRTLEEIKGEGAEISQSYADKIVKEKDEDEQ